MTEKELFKWEAKIDKAKDLWTVDFELSPKGMELVELFTVKSDDKHQYRNGDQLRNRRLVRRIIAGSHDLNSSIGAFWDQEFIKTGKVQIFLTDHIAVQGLLKSTKELFQSMAKNRVGIEKSFSGSVVMKEGQVSVKENPKEK